MTSCKREKMRLHWILLLLAVSSMILAPCVHAFTPAQAFSLETNFTNGVSLGGWMVMEDWMFDQMPMDSQLTWINNLRAEYNDNGKTAIQATKNHWANYIPTALLDDLEDFGITDVRLPVGYWCFEPPVGSSSVYDYGFQEEGFVTGCLNFVEPMLFELQQRGMNVLLDLHAIQGCSSSCMSYAGMMCGEEGSWFWNGSPPTIDGGCGDGSAISYNSSRTTKESWYISGQNTIVTIAEWINTMNRKLYSKAVAGNLTRGFITGFEILNEPGIGNEAVQPQVLQLTSTMVPIVQGIFKQEYTRLLSLQQSPVTTRGGVQLAPPIVKTFVNFITDWQGTGQWLWDQVGQGIIDLDYLVVDYHNYFNFGEINPNAEYWLEQECNADSCCLPYLNEYAYMGINMVIGEWSTAVSYDNITCFSTTPDGWNGTAFAGASFSNQLSNFYHYHSETATFNGAYFWTARMGSGWQAVPTSKYPNGHQVDGTDYNESLETFQYCQWNLVELIQRNAVLSIDNMQLEDASQGLCECKGCNPGTS